MVGDDRASTRICIMRAIRPSLFKPAGFFRISARTARKVVLAACSEINAQHGAEAPAVTVDAIAAPAAEKASDQYAEKYGEILRMPIESVEESPIGTSVVTDHQKKRISVVSDILQEVFPDTNENWYRDFSRDQHPESEIRIWEHIAKAYLKIEGIDYFAKAEKDEAYGLLLQRSLAPPKEVLKEYELECFSPEEASRIMAGYELSPKPITAMRMRAQTKAPALKPLSPIGEAIRNLFDPHP
jgi:hypothetical protein